MHQYRTWAIYDYIGVEGIIQGERPGPERLSWSPKTGRMKGEKGRAEGFLCFVEHEMAGGVEANRA